MRNKSEIVAKLSSCGVTCATMSKQFFDDGSWVYLFNLRSHAFGNQLASFHVQNVIELGVKIAEWLIREGDVTDQFRDELESSFPRLLRHHAEDFKGSVR